jgi:hypothetical protein
MKAKYETESFCAFSLADLLFPEEA